MKKYLVNYATNNFKESQQLLNQSARAFGIDTIFSYTPDTIKSTEFYKKNQHILKQRRGSGYWLWKPYIILRALQQIDDGDILVYADSGIEIIADLSPLFTIAQNGHDIITFNNREHINKTWTKRDCFILMDCDSEQYWNARHRFGSFQIYKKSPVSIKFVTDWLTYGEDERIITDMDNVMGKDNLDGFIEHRHDQSILTNLAIRENLEIFRDPTQRGNYLKLIEFREEGEIYNDYSPVPYSNSPYKTLLNHHRMRKGILKDKIRNRIIKTLKYFHIITQ